MSIKEYFYALVDANSGFVWWSGWADSPESACSMAGLHLGGEWKDYERTDSRNDTGGGYFVYAAPLTFILEDGQDAATIAQVNTFPLIGKYRAVT